MIIRRSKPSDADALFRVWERAVDATHHFLTASDRQEIARLVREDYLPAASLLVAEDDDGRPIGFLGLSERHIDSLFVDPAVHGRGVGRALIAHVRGDSEGLTVDVNEQNEGAVGFYERLGFRTVGRSALDDGGRPYPLLHMQLA